MERKTSLFHWILKEKQGKKMTTVNRFVMVVVSEQMGIKSSGKMRSN